MKEKPVISAEARDRILGFVKAVEQLQVACGVTIHADDGSLVLRDDKRSDEWEMSDGSVYGQWDAAFFGTDSEYPYINLAQLEFEDFDGWDK